MSRCLTNLHVAFDGNDKDSQVFESGHQVRKLNDASVAGLYKTSISAAGFVVG